MSTPNKSVKDFIADIGIYVAIASIAAYLVGVIDLPTMLSLAAMFGYASVQAIRELFLAGSIKTRVVTVVGVLTAAVFGYGSLTAAPWASAEQFGFVLTVVFGIQLAALGHGVAKSKGQLK